MRPRVALFDSTLDSHLESFLATLPAQWTYRVIACDTSSHHTENLLEGLVVPRSRGQSCSCSHAVCFRDAVVAHVPDRAIIAAVLLQPSLQCIAECADVVFAVGTVAQWCYRRHLPVRHARSVEQLLSLFARAMQHNTIATRHQAQLYRKHLVEIE